MYTLELRFSQYCLIYRPYESALSGNKSLKNKVNSSQKIRLNKATKQKMRVQKLCFGKK